MSEIWTWQTDIPHSASTGKNLTHALFQFLGQFFQLFLWRFAGQLKTHFNAPATAACAVFQVSRFSALARPLA